MYISADTLTEMRSENGQSVNEMSQQQPVILVFLRHFGCIFCKEALDDLAAIRKDIEDRGIRLVFVHMSAYSVADRYFKRYQLDGVTQISDPDQRYYKKFNLARGSFSQLYGLQTWIRGYSLKNNGYELEKSKTLGDSTQMPGIFLIQNGEIKEYYIHKRASDRPDYEKLFRSFVFPVK